MTHEERIVYCKTCEHKKVDYERGIVCELTDERPDFEGTCASYTKPNVISEAYTKDLSFKKALPLKPNKKRAEYVIYALYANLVLGALTLVSLLNESRVLKKYMEGGDVSDATFSSTDLFTGIVGGLTALTIITTAVLFIMWFRRAYYNLHLKVNYCKYPENQALWSWFIPILNLFRPNEIMREMVDATAELLHMDEKSVSKIKTIVLFWWIAWVVNNISSQIVWRIYKVPSSAEMIIQSNNAELAILPFDIIAAILAILVVKKYSKLEDQLMLRDNAADELDQIGVSV